MRLFGVDCHAVSMFVCRYQTKQTPTLALCFNHKRHNPTSYSRIRFQPYIHGCVFCLVSCAQRQNTRCETLHTEHDKVKFFPLFGNAERLCVTIAAM